MKIDLELPRDVDPTVGEAARRAATEAAVLTLYERGAISAGKAAEVLGMGLEQFLRWASSEGVPVFDLDAAELET